MTRYEKKALEITTQIVVAKMQNSTTSCNEATGKQIGEFFTEIYKSVCEITEAIKD